MFFELVQKNVTQRATSKKEREKSQLNSKDADRKKRTEWHKRWQSNAKKKINGKKDGFNNGPPPKQENNKRDEKRRQMIRKKTEQKNNEKIQRRKEDAEPTLKKEGATKNTKK